jgi:diguanylate cyclase (GGDEF)-like protein
LSLKDSLSLFGHEPDRGTNVAYFLGAIVPLIALGIVLERYVLAPFLPGVERFFNLGRAGTLALFMSIATLSLMCFLVLRRLVRHTIEENRLLALYDSLTGLPNRCRYRERLDQALLRADCTGIPLATCFIDLDGFKQVNDTLGHRAGDALLTEVAKRIVQVVRATDSVGRAMAEEEGASVSRIGGDEFTLLLPEISEDLDAGRVARRILKALREPFVWEGHEITITASIGIAVYPVDGDDAESLLRNADTAMYYAKARGRNNYQFFSSAMNEETERKIEIERKLRRAIRDGEFGLHFQPIRETAGGGVRAAEVLLRWQDPEVGDVPPGDFVPVAEDTGLILPIGSWVLRAACEQARCWQDEGFEPIRIAVNVSGYQIRQSDFVEEVAAALRESRLAPEHLELEITESTIMQEDEETDRAFRELHELGVGLVLDDFGTGYSSLSYLRRFHISRVKIDRSFVARIPDDPEDMAVTAAIVAMSHQLLLSVVGEGVETEEQARSLTELGVEELQGYLFGPPVESDAFERFLTREKTNAQ